MYGDNARLLFTDTDSLAYDNTVADFYKDINPTMHPVDISNYPAGHSSGIPVGVKKKLIDMLKDECGGKSMT